MCFLFAISSTQKATGFIIFIGMGRIWLVAGTSGLAAWTAVCLWFPLTDTDIWWHLAAAKWMSIHGTIPRVDPFCLSSLGKPWIDLHWGFQLLAHVLWSLGESLALVAGKVTILLLAVALALRPHLRTDSAWFLIPFAAFGIYHVRFFLDMRPLVITLLGLSALYAGTWAYLQGRFRHPWLILLPVQVVLANTQGLFPLGAFLVSCLLVGAWWDRRPIDGQSLGAATPSGLGPIPLRPLAFTAAGLWLAGLANPYGWKGFLLPLSLLARITPLPGNVFSAEIAENQPLHDLVGRDPSALAPYLLLATAVGWTFHRTRSRFSTGHFLLFAGFAVLGLMAQRNLPLFLLAGLMAAGRNLQVSHDPPFRPGARPWLGPAALLALVGAYAPSLVQAWRYELPGSLETPFRFPEGAVDFLKQHPLPGGIFNELRFGGYLDFRLYPEKRPFVDGRMILRDAEFYRGFLAVVDHPELFPPYAGTHGFTHALLPIGEDRRFLPLAAYLIREKDWALLYSDGASVLLADAGTAPSLALSLDSLGPSHPVSRALKERFHANPRLESIALRNLTIFLEASNKAKSAF